MECDAMQQNEVLNQSLDHAWPQLAAVLGAAWPWTGSSSTVSRAAIEALIGEQADHIRQLAELLDSRGWTIDFGVFPDFTDLHYLSLQYVLPHLVENERAVIGQIEAAVPRCAGDEEAVKLLSEIGVGERSILTRLDDFSRSAPAAASQSAAEACACPSHPAGLAWDGYNYPAGVLAGRSLIRPSTPVLMRFPNIGSPLSSLLVRPCGAPV